MLVSPTPATGSSGVVLRPCMAFVSSASGRVVTALLLLLVWQEVKAACESLVIICRSEIRELTCNTRLLDFSRMHWFSGSRLLAPGLSWLFERAGELGELNGRKGLLSFWVKY